MNTISIGRLYLVVLVITLSAPAALGSTLAVNFVNDPNDTFQQQPGFESFYVPNNVGTAPGATILAGTADGVEVHVASGFGLVRSIDRGNVRVYRGELSNLSISWIGNGHGAGYFFIHLRGVTAGLHHWTSYHVDNGLGYQRNGDQNGLMSIELSLDGGASYEMLNPLYRILDAQIDTIPTVQPRDPPNFLFHTSFEATGNDDIVFRFRNVARGPDHQGQYPVGADFTVINAFRLTGPPTRIPEPSTIAFAALAFLGLFGKKWSQAIFLPR